MDLKSHHNVSDNTEGGAMKTHSQSECISDQPKANGTLWRHPTGQAPLPCSDRLQEANSSHESLTDSFSTNDISQLLPTPHKQKGVVSSSESPLPVCSPPSSSTSRPSQSSTCNLVHNQTTNEKRLSSTKSHASFKTDAAHIKEVAGNDCCVHCLLACLFCELLSMCSALGECLACGVGGAGCCEASACCCCVEAAGEAACTEEACQSLLDCGMLENCCASSDCLEICLECCSIVFPS
ncbi:myoD family inhibitor domain-containing protein [Girardinichthys multiradiatus]|uniref:myoD family inhibitor domain-containing protein n=1 Tax=Girardinichthys multiradiatus TaxID=208333 RepID=UPI001FAD8910|nr:myoD family inhibitor domain-containing protein [Girardinichthys multiradiatus]